MIVTGAAGFVGYHLTRTLVKNGYGVYAVVRPASAHNVRIKNMRNVRCIEENIEDSGRLSALIPGRCDYFFHLAWKPTDRYDYAGQMESAYLTIKMLETAAQLGCRRFIGIGSQAEYGVTKDIIDEENTPERPFCGYGAAKVAAAYMSRRRAQELRIEWVWGRIFSVYGEYEPDSRLLPSLINSFLNGEDVFLSSGRQNWDFINGEDAGEALIAMAERGRAGEIYNIADGRYRPLKEYVEELALICRNTGNIIYGDDPEPFVSLQPSVKKLTQDTGWEPKVSFDKGVRKLMLGNSDNKW